jgi:hypothetical protein
MYRGVAMAPLHAIICIMKARLVIVKVMFSKVFQNSKGDVFKGFSK